jgi:acylphosphatase
VTLGQVTRRFLITGKVQGVFFRQSTRLEAERLGIRGLARNLPGGSVEVIAHGTPDAVESLRRWLQRGPPAAKVANVRELEVTADLDPGVRDGHVDPGSAAGAGFSVQ